MSRPLLAYGAILGFLGVALGAFGAHALSGWFAPRPDRLLLWQTAVHYHLIHALAAVFASILAAHHPGPFPRRAGACFATGVILFSGSLYLLALEAVPRWFGAITPVGGVLFLAGWMFLALSARKTR